MQTAIETTVGQGISTRVLRLVCGSATAYLDGMSVLRRNRTRSAETVEASIAIVLAEVGPLLRIEHCQIEIAEYSELAGRLVLRIDGNCPDCELSPATFMPAIEAHLKLRVPEIREVSVATQ